MAVGGICADEIVSVGICFGDPGKPEACREVVD